jgi:hypothetical protein
VWFQGRVEAGWQGFNAAMLLPRAPSWWLTACLDCDFGVSKNASNLILMYG